MSTKRQNNKNFAVIRWLSIVLVGFSAAGASYADDEFAERVKADTEWLTSYGTRQIGTPEHARLQDDLLAKVSEIPNVKVLTQEFPVVVPVDKETFLEIKGGSFSGRHKMFPVWPDVGRLNTTDANGIRGKLIYIKDASFANLPARSLRGNIAVMESSDREYYRNAFNFGAAAVIFLESDKAGKSVPTQQSLYKPRYYLEAGPLADALRENKVSKGRIVCRGSWETVKARNIYVAIKPDNPTDDQPYAIVAPYDSMSFVLGVAPGADTAVDCATVLNMLRDQAGNPDRPLLFGFVDAYHINQMGMRYMSAMMTVIPEGKTRREYAKIEQEELEGYRDAAEEAAQFKTAEEGLAALHDRNGCKNIRRLFKDAVGPDLLRLKEAQGELQLAALRAGDENTPIVCNEMLSALKDGTAALLEHHEDELSEEDIAECNEIQEFVDRVRPAVMEAMEILPGEQVEGSKDNQEEIFLEARKRSKEILPLCLKPLRARNRILEAAYSEKITLKEEYLPVARELWANMLTRIDGQLAEQEQRIRFFEPLDKMRSEIAGYLASSVTADNADVCKFMRELAKKVVSLMPGCLSFRESTGDKPVCRFVLGLDLSDCGILVGPGAYDGYNRTSLDSTYREFARTLKKAVKRGELWPETDPTRRVVNIDSIEGRVGDTGNLGERALITAAAQSFQLPGVTWVTDDAPRTLVDSPLDLYERLDWSRIVPQLPATLRFFEWVLTTDDFKSDPRGVDDTAAKWRNGMGRVVDVSAGETVPRVPRVGFLATLVGSAPDRDGIRRNEFTWTGHDGGFRLPILCADILRWEQAYNLAAFKLDKNGAFVEALTTTESLVTTRLTTTFNLGSKPGDQLPRAVTFQCAELNGPSFFDARFLEPLVQARLIDTVRGGAPKQSHFSVDHTGQIWGLVAPDIRWQLIMRAGAARTRLALLNAVPDGRERGMTLRQTFLRGFVLDEPLPSIPPYVSARDISVLDDWRLADFRSAGIESKKVDEIRKDTIKFLADADKAIEKDDGAGLQRSATQALASEIRAYQAVKDMGIDIARGAIFLMLMLVPFCIAMERLLFAFSRIGFQICASLAIFALMTALLWSFHPAFRISAQPLVIVMAFTILAMSVVVISMVLRRFQASVREFQSSLAEGSGAKMGRGGLLGSAVFLGIANMRKRKVRTLLTGTTIVLVTFALLCFSSTSSYLDKKDFKLKDIEAQHPAILIRRPSFGPLDENAIPVMRNLLGKEDVNIGERIWLGGGLGEVTWRLYAINPETGKQAGITGALGLPPVENKLTGVDRVLDNWDEFAEHGGCYLPPDTAAQLGVKVGDTVVVRGLDLVVRGIFDPVRLEDEVALLDGQRITPYDYTKEEKDWIDRDSQDAIEQETGSAAAMQPAANDADRYIQARDLIILPADQVRDLGGSLRSFGIACSSVQQAKKVANLITRTVVYPAYYSNADGGVNVLVSTPLIVVPPKNLAIPLIIAALIIFTTMLNSVSERKSEIYVYTSLGLAPTHVGMLFVAEALTYGLMGSVFGYVAGQGTATVLTGLGMMQGITLNYSGTAVIKTMLLVQCVVVMSAIVPAIVAGKIAAPSTEMDWKVPQPVDGVISDSLPFTVSPAAASGLVAFIHEYLEAHRDGVLGAFDVDKISILPPGEHGVIAGLETRLWLEPFDMGVRQWMRLTVNEPQDGACSISVEIRHEAGTPKMWWRLNKPFFFDLRRQLLGWRKVGEERMLKYIENAERVMANA